MAEQPKLTLSKARAEGKLDQFIAEREPENGDEAAFNRLFESMAGKSKEASEASSPDECDG